MEGIAHRECPHRTFAKLECATGLPRVVAAGAGGSDADNTTHLRLLARVAEMFSDDEFRADLMSASDVASIRSTFTRWIERGASGSATMAA